MSFRRPTLTVTLLAALAAALALPARPIQLAVEPTVLLVQNQGQAEQIFTARYGSSVAGAEDLRLVVSDGERKWQFPLSETSDGEMRFSLPRAIKTKSLSVWLAKGEEPVTAPLAVQQRPVRDWRIYYQTTPHIDLGYTDLVANVEARLREMTLDGAFQLLNTTGGYPPGERLHWTSESSWFFDLSVANLTSQATHALDSALARRQLSIGSVDFNLHSELCTFEELIRSLFRARRLADKYPGLDASVAMQSDPPGHAWGLAQALASSGIRYLAIWANNAHPMAAALPEVFYWEVPDGNRVLTAYQTGYAATRFGSYRRLDPTTGKDLEVDQDVLIAELEEKANQTLLHLERSEYPFDALLSRITGRDNGLPPEHMAEFSRAWNAKYVSPRVLFSGPGEYFRYIDANFRNRIPVLRGDLNSWWIDGAASLTRGNALSRRAKTRIPAAEMLAAATLFYETNSNSYPAGDLSSLYGALLRYDEHTFGLRAYDVRGRVLSQGEQLDSPEWERWRQSWRDKEQWAEQADRESQKVLNESLSRLARQLSADRVSVVAFNPTARLRDEVVRLPWQSETQLPAIIDPASGKRLPVQADSGELIFVATGLPPLGYKIFPLDHEGGARAVHKSTGVALENRYYKITLAAQRSGLFSILDKETGEELLDPKPPHLFGQIIYQGYSGIANRDRHRDTAGTALPLRFSKAGPHSSAMIVKGQVFDEMKWTASLEDVPGRIPLIEQAVRLCHSNKVIELITRINDKKPTAQVEAIYLSLPFGINSPSWAIENAGVRFEPYQELLPGTNPNAFAVGRWLMCKNSDHFVAVSPLEAPLVELGEIRALKLEGVGHYRPAGSHVYSHLMNNFWGTNFPLWQGGDFAFSYLITSGKNADAFGSASRLGDRLHMPGVATVVQPQQGSLPSKGSFFLFSGVEVDVLALKRSEDGPALVLRVADATGRGGTLRIEPSLLPFNSVFLSDGLEKTRHKLKLVNQGVELQLGKNQVVTLQFFR